MKTKFLLSILLVIAANQFAISQTDTSESVIGTMMLQAKGKVSPESLKRILVPRGSIVTLTVKEDVNSDAVIEGSVVRLEASVPLYIDGQEVLLRGSYGEAIVVKAKPCRSFGRPGEITIKADNIMTFDNSRIRLGGSELVVRGRSRKGIAWGLTAIIVMPGLGFTVKGLPGQLERGVSLNAITTQDVYVRANPNNDVTKED